MDRPIAYQGDAQYIFISYAHKDAERVLPLISKMQRDGFRVWYDEGITPGDEWDDNIAAHLVNSSFFLGFLSRNYLDSENCKDELYYAFDLNKPQVIVYLESVDLPQRMELRMGRASKTVADRKGRFLRKLYRQKEMIQCHNQAMKLRWKNLRQRILTAVLVLAMVVCGCYGYQQIDFEELQYRLEEYFYPKEQQKSILLRKDGITVIARGIELDEEGQLKIHLFLENTTDRQEWLYFEDLHINKTEIMKGTFRLDPNTATETEWIIPAEYLAFSDLEALEDATDVTEISAVLRLSENKYESEVIYYPYGREYAMRKR